MTATIERTRVHPKLEQWSDDLYVHDRYDSEEQAPEPGEEACMSNFRPARSYTPDTSPLFIMPDIFTYGDYAGSMVEKANNMAAREEWLGENVREYDVYDALDEPDTIPHVHGVYGGHGSNAIAINVTDISDEHAEQIADALESLDDYPLLDEELHSELELAAQDEAWESWVAWDFAKRLSDLSDLDIERDETLDGPLFELFWTEAERQNEYWITEGVDAWIDLDRVVPDVPRHSDHWLALVQQARSASDTGAWLKELALTSWVRAGE